MAIKVGKELETGLALRQVAETLVIKDQTQYDLTADLLQDIKTKMKEVETAMDPQCKSAYNTWQVALNQKKAYLKPYEEAETLTKKSMSNYVMEQKRISDLAEAEAREVARMAEARERTKLLKKAAKQEAKGDTYAAEELQEQAAAVFVPVVAPDHSVSKVTGVTTAEDFDIEVTDMITFVEWLTSTNLDVANIITIKVQPIKQYIKLTRMTSIPGVRINKKVIISAKGK